jgi:lipopolysaccharide assembly outer membrane protein LptD (OstA)
VEVYALNRYFTSCFISLLLAALVPPALARADAFLSEDSIYYSADRYDIDYGNKIITARGNALFRRGDIRVGADKAVIRYAQDDKKAYFYGGVRLENVAEGYTVGGRYGEVHYLKRYAFVEGDGYYRDESRVIRADRVEAAEGGERSFTGHVVFQEGEVLIESESLLVRGKESAVFSGGSRIVFTDSGDRLLCSRVSQDLTTGVSECTGDVMYLEAVDGGESNRSPFVIHAAVMRYHPDSNTYICLDDVRAVNEEYTLTAPVLRYDRKREIMTTEGQTVVRSRTGTVYCTRLTFDVPSGTAEFAGRVRGIVADGQGDGR